MPFFKTRFPPSFHPFLPRHHQKTKNFQYNRPWPYQNNSNYWDLPSRYLQSILGPTFDRSIYMKFQISETCLYVLISYICNLPMINHKFCYNSLYSNNSNFLANQFISSIHSNSIKSQWAQMILKVRIKVIFLLMLHP